MNSKPLILALADSNIVTTPRKYKSELPHSLVHRGSSEEILSDCFNSLSLSPSEAGKDDSPNHCETSKPQVHCITSCKKKASTPRRWSYGIILSHQTSNNKLLPQIVDSLDSVSSPGSLSVGSLLNSDSPSKDPIDSHYVHDSSKCTLHDDCSRTPARYREEIKESLRAFDDPEFCKNFFEGISISDSPETGTPSTLLNTHPLHTNFKTPKSTGPKESCVDENLLCFRDADFFNNFFSPTFCDKSP